MLLYANISSNYERLNERLKNLKTSLYKRLKRIVAPGFEPGSEDGRSLMHYHYAIPPKYKYMFWCAIIVKYSLGLDSYTARSQAITS